MDSLTLDTKFDDKLTELLQQRVGVTDQQLQMEQWIRALFFLPLRHGGASLTSAVNTRHAAFLAAVLNGLDPLQQLGADASGLKAQALQALEKCIEQATKNSQLSVSCCSRRAAPMIPSTRCSTSCAARMDRSSSRAASRSACAPPSA